MLAARRNRCQDENQRQGDAEDNFFYSRVFHTHGDAVALLHFCCHSLIVAGPPAVVGETLHQPAADEPFQAVLPPTILPVVVSVPSPDQSWKVCAMRPGGTALAALKRPACRSLACPVAWSRS